MANTRKEARREAAQALKEALTLTRAVIADETCAWSMTELDALARLAREQTALIQRINPGD